MYYFNIADLPSKHKAISHHLSASQVLMIKFILFYPMYTIILIKL